MAFKIFVAVLLFFIVGNLLFFLWQPLNYHLSLRRLRKGLYTLYVGAIAVGLLLDEIQLSNWQFLLSLTAVVIFVDLSILLTPSIMKIWKAEFQYTDYVENIIIRNNKFQKATVRRVVTMSEMIQNAGTDFLDISVPFDESGRKKQLKNYLNRYAQKYGFTVQLWEIEPVARYSSIPQEELEGLSEEEIDSLAMDYGFYEEIKNVLMRVEELNNFEFEDEIEDHAESLYESEIVSLIKEDSMIVPVFLKRQSWLIVLRNGDGELLEVDGVHIANLTFLFYSFS